MIQPPTTLFFRDFDQKQGKMLVAGSLTIEFKVVKVVKCKKKKKQQENML